MPSAPLERLRTPPPIAVVLVGRGVPGDADRTLASLATQTMPAGTYEVVVVHDPRCEEMRGALARHERCLPAIGVEQRWSGRGAARTLGTLSTAAPLVLFLECGDIAAPALLAQHVATHAVCAGRHQAVVSRHGRRPPADGDLPIDALIRRQEPERTAWAVWAGRPSYKRSILLDAGLFNAQMKQSGEDVELLTRLSGHGVEWLTIDTPLTRSNETDTLEAFVERCEVWGRALYTCAELHSTDRVVRATGVDVDGAASERAMHDHDATLGAVYEIAHLTARRASTGPAVMPEDHDAAVHACTALARNAILRGVHHAAAAHQVIAARSHADDDWAASAADPQLDFVVRSFANGEEWERYATPSNADYATQMAVESRLPIAAGATIPGYCAVCFRAVAFQVTDRYVEEIDNEIRPNWREQLTCEGCGLNSRKRAAVQAVDELLRVPHQGIVLIAEQTTVVYRALLRRYPNLIGCEYLGPHVTKGSCTTDGIRHEDLTALTFADGQFDAVLAFDVLEHLHDTTSALSECWRVLAGGGQLLFTVPFWFAAGSQVLAREGPMGTIDYVAPPVYHENPLSPDGSLVFHDFGWDLLELARAIGFEQVSAHHYWSERLAYFGPQLLFTARKPLQPSSISNPPLRAARRASNAAPRRLHADGPIGIDADERRLSFVLPLALSGTGRPGSDLERVRMLFDSFTRCFASRHVGTFLVVAPPRDLIPIEQALQILGCGGWVTLADERQVCPVLSSDPDTSHTFPAPNQGWHRQQLVKLAAARHVSTPFYMTLDADVVFTNAFEPRDLIHDGRAVVNVQTEDDFRSIYTATVADHEVQIRRDRRARAEDILGCKPVNQVFYGETPVVLSTSLVRDLLTHVGQRFGTTWDEALVGQLPWTEYALYFSFAEATGRFDLAHRRGDLNSVLRFTDCVWRPEGDYQDGRSLATWTCTPAHRRDSVAVVVQSYLGYEPREVRRRLNRLGLLH